MPLWLAPQPLVLASKSDVRGKMLAAVGLRFEIRSAQIDERAVEAKAGTTDAAATAQPRVGSGEGRSSERHWARLANQSRVSINRRIATA